MDEPDKTLFPGDRVICLLGELAGDIATVVEYSHWYSQMAGEHIYVIMTEDSEKFWATENSIEKSIYQGEELDNVA